MKAPAQILCALAAAGTAAFFPLSARFSEAATLTTAAEKKRAAEKASASAAAKTFSPGLPGAAAGAAGASAVPQLSPAEASAFLADLASLDGKLMSSRRIIELLDKIMSLPASHLKEASAVIAAQKNMIYGGFLSAALFSRWGELDPDSARAHLEEDKSGNPMTKFIGSASLAGGWLEKDPDSFIRWATDSGDAKDKDPKQAEMKRMMLEAVAGGMGELDSATFERLLAASPADRRGQMILKQAQSDPDADPMQAVLRAYAEAGDSQNARQSLNWSAGRMLAEKDPELAIKFAQENQKPDERGQTYEAAMDVWVKRDEKAAYAWLQTQDEKVQEQAVNGLRGELKGLDYEGVDKLTAGLHAPAASNLWEMAAEQTAAKDPAKAVAYLPNIAEDERPGSYQELSETWTKKDPEAASIWIDELQPGQEKDHAIRGMIGQLSAKEPDAATIWASSMTDGEMRASQVTHHAKIWLKRDEAAATEWIQTTETLNDQQREQLLAK